MYATISDIDFKHTNYKVDFTAVKINVKQWLRLANNKTKYAENNYIYAFMFNADRLNFFLLHAIYVRVGKTTQHKINCIGYRVKII